MADKISFKALRQDAWNLHLLTSIHSLMNPVTTISNIFVCRSVLTPSGGSEIPVIQSAAMVFTRSCFALCGNPIVLKLFSPVPFEVDQVGPVCTEQESEANGEVPRKVVGKRR